MLLCGSGEFIRKIFKGICCYVVLVSFKIKIFKLKVYVAMWFW